MARDNKIRFTVENEEGDEVEYALPGRWEVCENCRGNGTHVDRNIDGNGLTAEDFAEDQDFADDYMSGHFDVTCDECHGQRVVLDVDETSADPAVLALYERKLDAEYQARREDRYTRWMESGGRYD